MEPVLSKDFQIRLCDVGIPSYWLKSDYEVDHVRRREVCKINVLRETEQPMNEIILWIVWTN